MEGRTFDGVPFRGSDVVEITNVASRASLELDAVGMPTKLALAVQTTDGRIALLVGLPAARQQPWRSSIWREGEWRREICPRSGRDDTVCSSRKNWLRVCTSCASSRGARWP
jgi:hypothetical protein